MLISGEHSAMGGAFREAKKTAQMNSPEETVKNERGDRLKKVDFISSLPVLTREEKRNLTGQTIWASFRKRTKEFVIYNFNSVLIKSQLISDDKGKTKLAASVNRAVRRQRLQSIWQAARELPFPGRLFFSRNPNDSNLGVPN